jgi:hypothetical protein
MLVFIFLKNLSIYNRVLLLLTEKNVLVFLLNYLELTHWITLNSCRFPSGSYTRAWFYTWVYLSLCDIFGKLIVITWRSHPRWALDLGLLHVLMRAVTRRVDQKIWVHRCLSSLHRRFLYISTRYSFEYMSSPSCSRLKNGTLSMFKCSRKYDTTMRTWEICTFFCLI